MAYTSPLRTVIVVGLCLFGSVGVRLTAQQPAGPGRTITTLRGDLYRVQDNTYSTFFYVTPDGIVVGDPIATSTAIWLKAELANRFPGQAVRYVLLSHHDFDHAAGAQVFDDTAEIIGDERFNRELARARTELPAAYAALDRNRDGRAERAELSGAPFASAFDQLDRNGDGAITPSELYQDVLSVESTVAAQRTLVLGGRTIHLISTGVWHAEDMMAIHFPAERAVVSIDYPPVRQVPLFLRPTPAAHIEGVRRLEALDFDLILTGHGQVGTKEDVAAYRRYVEEIVAGVQAGMAARRTLEQIQAELTLERYSGWENYARARRGNIADVYAALGVR